VEESQKLGFLKDEYLHLQKVIEDFDGRAVTIKAWSVSFSLAALVGSFVSHASSVLLLASFSTLLFWITEAFWKTFQYAYYDRAGKLERFFAGDLKDLVPFQIGASWYNRWSKGGTKRFLRIMFWPHVALPHVAILFVGVGLYLLALGGAIKL